MMTRSKSSLVVVLCLILVSGVMAQEGESLGEGALENHPEVDEVLQALDEAEVPPTAEELAGFMATVDVQGSVRGKKGRSFPFQGQAALRWARIGKRDWGQYGKLDLSSRWLRVGARFRKYDNGEKVSGGVVSLGQPAAELRFGTLGMAHGFGLLMGAPGRGSSLTADAGMKPPPRRLVTWMGSPDPRALTGWGGTLRRGIWSLAVLSGQAQSKPSEEAPVFSALQVGASGKTWHVSAAALARPQERGGSLAWGVQSNSLTVNVEGVLWQSGSGIPPVLSMVGHLGWAVTRKAGIEFEWGFADQPGGPQLASRPAVLPGWSGRGFALRGYAPLGEGLRLRVLLWGGQLPDRAGIRGQESKSLVDLLVTKKLRPGLNLSARFRSTGRRRREWSARYPWQPAQLSAQEDREVLTGQVVWDTSDLRTRMMVRSYGKAANGAEGRRSLVGLSVRLKPAPGWTFRGSLTTAWGDPVDLVSAVSPVTGLVLPRHWGNWRSESMAGLEWSGHGARVQAAVSSRLPEGGQGALPVLTIWTQAGLAW